MSIIKIKKPRDPNEEQSVKDSEPKFKKIRIKTKPLLEDEPPLKPKIKINLKKGNTSLAKGPLKKERSGTNLKVKLNLKKVDERDKVPKVPRLRLKPIRVPGDGYDSEASDIEEDPLIESGIILRVFPDLQVDFIKNSIESGDYSGISIKWKGDRHATVTVNDVMYGAVLVDLPTIIEVNKSVDRKNLLKTVDVDQMLLCVQVLENEDEVFQLQPPDTDDLISKEFDEVDDEINDNKKLFFKGMHGNQLSEAEQTYLNQITQKKYDYKHGLSPALYNVRNRRFRRKMGPTEFEYVEKSVEMLLKQDDGSEEVTYELVDPDQTTVTTATTPVASAASPVSQPAFELQTTGVVEDEDELDLDEAFQSEEEETAKQIMHTDADGNVIPDEGAQYSDAEVDVDIDDEEKDDEDDDDEDENDEYEDDDEGAVQKDAGRQHTELLADELNELESTLSHTKRKVEKATNPLLKSRFLDSIKKLEKEVDLKRKQLRSSEDFLKKAGLSEGNESPTRDEEEDEEDNDDDNDNDNEEDDEDNEDDVEDDVEDDEEQGQNQDEAGESEPQDQEQVLDQNDLDMMMLFGAEGDEADE